MEPQTPRALPLRAGTNCAYNVMMPIALPTSGLPDIIDTILPAREVSILAGASGAGKTTLVMQMLKSLQRNESVFGHVAQHHQRIGYIAADRNWKAYARLAATVGLDLSHI